MTVPFHDAHADKYMTPANLTSLAKQSVHGPGPWFGGGLSSSLVMWFKTKGRQYLPLQQHQYDMRRQAKGGPTATAQKPGPRMPR
jgi:hypothetical protein